MERTLIRATGLSFGYDESRNVFEEVSFSLNPGRLYALMGGNGSGKTTILRCLAGLLEGYSGDIRLSGDSIARLGRKGSPGRSASCPRRTRSFPTW